MEYPEEIIRPIAQAIYKERKRLNLSGDKNQDWFEAIRRYEQLQNYSKGDCGQ